MTFKGIDLLSRELNSISNAFKAAYSNLPQHWKRDVYNATLVVLRKEVPYCIEKLTKQYPDYEFISVRKISVTSSDIDVATEVIRIMVSYLDILLTEDTRITNIFNEAYDCFLKGSTENQEHFLQLVAIWLLGEEHRDVLHQNVMSFCSSIDQQLRGLNVPRYLHGLVVC